jgi:small subunit ribosomal protein S20
MANHKSSEKRARQTVKRTEENRVRKSRVSGAVRKVNEATDAKDYKGGMTALSKAQSELARAATRGAIPKKRIARKMSRLSARLKKVK